MIFFFFAGKRPVGKSVSRPNMNQAIKDLKINLRNLENVEADNRLKSEVNWIEDKDERIDALSEVISFTSEKEAGRNNFNIIYGNYRKLDFWKELYEDKDKENDFDKEFQLAMKKIDDKTKSNLRYNRWTKIFKMLPTGSYNSCTIPNSYWRLIHVNDFDEIIKYFNEG
jgi:hypothetical protein